MVEIVENVLKMGEWKKATLYTYINVCMYVCVFYISSRNNVFVAHCEVKCLKLIIPFARNGWTSIVSQAEFKN